MENEKPKSKILVVMIILLISCAVMIYLIIERNAKTKPKTEIQVTETQQEEKKEEDKTEDKKEDQKQEETQQQTQTQTQSQTQKEASKNDPLASFTSRYIEGDGVHTFRELLDKYYTDNQSKFNNLSAEDKRRMVADTRLGTLRATAFNQHVFEFYGIANILDGGTQITYAAVKLQKEKNINLGTTSSFMGIYYDFKTDKTTNIRDFSVEVMPKGERITFYML